MALAAPIAPTIYTIHYQFSFLKVQGEYGTLLTSPSKKTAPRNMYKTNLHKAIEAVPKFEERISLFTKKLRLAQYAEGTIYDYRLKIAQRPLRPNFRTNADPAAHLQEILVYLRAIA